MSGISGIDQSGNFNSKDLTAILDDLRLYFRMMHGPDVGIDETDPDGQLIEAVAPEIRTLWAGMLGAFLQAFITTATGAGLDQAVSVLRMTRRLATRATREVTLSRNDPAPAGGILVPQGTVVSTVAGVGFSTDEDATIAAAGTSVVAAVTAVVPGVEGNVASGTVTEFVSTVAGVDSVTNASGMTGGTDQESDASLRARALTSSALRGKATAAAVAAHVAAVEGVTAVTVLKNATDDTSADVLTFESNETGTDSQSIDGATRDKIAQRFVVPAEGAWVQDIRFVADGAAVTLDVRVETDVGAEPSGVLASTHLEKQDFVAANGTTSSVHFERPGFLAAGTYWATLVRVAGTFTLDGGAGGTANQVFTHATGGAWAADTGIENGNVDVISGIPPHSVEAFVEGGADQDVWDSLLDSVAVGIRTWGTKIGTATDTGGQVHDQRFSRPEVVNIFVDVTIPAGGTNEEWDPVGGPDAIRDAIVLLVGGEDTKGLIWPGLTLGGDVFRAEVIEAIMSVTGLRNITLSTLKIDDVDPPVDTSGNAVTIGLTQVARIGDAALDIDVTDNS